MLVVHAISMECRIKDEELLWSGVLKSPRRTVESHTELMQMDEGNHIPRDEFCSPLSL